MLKRGKFFIRLLIMLMALGILGSAAVLADDGVKPKKVVIQKSSMTVYQGKEFKLRAVMTPKNADDDYLVWEIVSGGEYVQFDDDDLNDDDVELKAAKPGTAKIRCYIKGKDKTKYGDENHRSRR